MHFQRKPDALLVENIQNRVEPVGEILIPLVDHARLVGREGVEQMPDGAAGKAIHDRYAESGGGAGRIRKFRCSAGAHAFRVAVSPDVRRKNGLVALVNEIAHRLTDQVIADCPDFQAVFRKQIMPSLAISVVR